MLSAGGSLREMNARREKQKKPKKHKREERSMKKSLCS